MDDLQELTTQLANRFFEHAVLLLVDGESYIAHQHLLELIPLQHQLSFLTLLQNGTELRDCFAELDAFLAWRAVKVPLMGKQGIHLSAVSQQLAMYLLDKEFTLDWESLNFP